MRMMLTATIPHEPCNSLIRANKLGPILKRILDELKPEAVYFTELEGTRGVVLIAEVPDPSRIPSLAEPFFSQFQCRLPHPDLHDAGRPGQGRAGRDCKALGLKRSLCYQRVTRCSGGRYILSPGFSPNA